MPSCTIHDIALMMDRERKGREASPSASVIDGQTVKAPAPAAERDHEQRIDVSEATSMLLWVASSCARSPIEPILKRAPRLRLIIRNLVGPRYRDRYSHFERHLAICLALRVDAW